MSPPKHLWTTEQVEILRELYPYMRSHDIAARLGLRHTQVLDKASRLGFKKTKEAIMAVSKLAMQDPNHPGRKHQFHSAQTPWNKGTNYQAGGRSVETQFKGGRRGMAAYNWLPIGSERVSKDGYLQRKMTDTGVTCRDFVAVHWIIWHEAGHTVPAGHALIFKDGNKKNITLENLELITRADLMRRNSVHNYGPEIARIQQLRGAITRQINKKMGKHA